MTVSVIIAAFCMLPVEHQSIDTPGTIVTQLPPVVWWILQTRNGHTWFGSPQDGLTRYDGTKLVQFLTKDGLAHNHVRGLSEDKHGGLIISTSGGVSRFDGRKFKTLTPIVSTWPGTGWKLAPGDAWLLGNDSAGPFRFDGKTLYDLRFPRHPNTGASKPRVRNHGEYPDSIYSIYRDRRGDMWFGLSSLGFYRFNGKSMDWHSQRDLTETPQGGSMGIRAILQDRSGSFWISNNHQSFEIKPNSAKAGDVTPMVLKKQPGMPNAQGAPKPIYALSMIEDRNGHIWMVTFRDGVWRYDGNKVVRFPVKLRGREITLFSITSDKSGAIWLGTHEGGAFRFNGKSFEQFLPGKAARPSTDLR